MKCNYDKIVEHVLENQDKFYRIAYCYVYNPESAMDIVQNAIVKALENSHQLKNPDAIKTWFYRILVNESLTYLKKNSKEISCEPADLDDQIYYEPGFEPGLSLYSEINRLPKEQQTIILLHYYEDLSLKEISTITGVNLNTVKSRLYAGLDKLQKIIREMGHDDLDHAYSII